MNKKDRIVIAGSAVLGTALVVGALVSYNKFLSELLEQTSKQLDTMTDTILENVKK